MQAVNYTFPLKPENDALLVVMLTDGLPQSVTGDSSQNPCLLSPNYVTNQFNAYDARFLVVAVEGGSSIRNNQPFDCLFFPYELDESLINVNTSFIDLNEISPSIHNTIFEQVSFYLFFFVFVFVFVFAFGSCLQAFLSALQLICICFFFCVVPIFCIFFGTIFCAVYFRLIFFFQSL